jgi:hypothetical protein
MPKNWRHDGSFCEWCGNPNEMKEWYRTYKTSSGGLNRVIFRTRCSNFVCRHFGSAREGTHSMSALTYNRHVRDLND